MAKVYKSFQVRIDPTNRRQVPALPVSSPPVQKTDVNVSQTSDETLPDSSEESPEEFKEIPPDRLTSAQAYESSSEHAPNESAENNDGSGELLTDLEKFSRHEPVKEAPKQHHMTTAVMAARLSASLNTVKRRESELADLEAHLKEWEKTIQAREVSLDGEIAKIQAEAREKRATIDQESARIIEMAKKSAENLAASARAESDSLKRAAQIEADSLRKTVQGEIDQARIRAEKEGFAVGEERGIARGEKSGVEEMRLEWQNLMQETEQLINELQTSRMGILKSAEEEMVKLILAFAKRVIKTECQTRPAIVLSNIETALNKISAVDKIVLRINLRDKSMAESHKNDFLKRLSGVTELTIMEDNGLAPGGVKIETGVGTIDASVETQADELERAIMRVLDRSE
ncbi:MAG: hypothetical protein HQM09_11530 [Candidatus Riflebacteria bacterium]|nr:hypothetical protein [Candidatus Riflebacteria bacterium]